MRWLLLALVLWGCQAASPTGGSVLPPKIEDRWQAEWTVRAQELGTYAVRLRLTNTGPAISVLGLTATPPAQTIYEAQGVGQVERGILLASLGPLSAGGVTRLDWQVRGSLGGPLWLISGRPHPTMKPRPQGQPPPLTWWQTQLQLPTRPCGGLGFPLCDGQP